jgi:hypothetical protein
MPKLATVRPGVIVIFENGKPKERIFVAGGFAEVNSGDLHRPGGGSGDRSDLSLKAAEDRFAAADKAFQDSSATRPRRTRRSRPNSTSRGRCCSRRRANFPITEEKTYPPTKEKGLAASRRGLSVWGEAGSEAVAQLTVTSWALRSPSPPL